MSSKYIPDKPDPSVTDKIKGRLTKVEGIVAELERSSAAKDIEISGLKTKLTATETDLLLAKGLLAANTARLTATETKLAATEAVSAENKAELVATKARFAANEAELETTKASLIATNAELVEVKQETAELKQMVLALTAQLDKPVPAPAPKPLPAPAPKPVPVVAPKPVLDEVDGRRIRLSWEGARFDKNGLMYLVATKGKTTNYTNPHELHARDGGGMVASMSSVYVLPIS